MLWRLHEGSWKEACLQEVAQDSAHPREAQLEERGMGMSSPDKRTEVRDLLWENEYNLSTTAIEAMEILWGDYDNIVKWIVDEQGLTEVDFLIILSDLTLFVASMPAVDRHKPAMQVYAEWSR